MLKIKRRTLLCGLGASILLNFIPNFTFAQIKRFSLPIIMFHKIDDEPHYPEDINSSQLHTFFRFIWKEGFYPVNISDILDNKIDKIVPKGLKPIAITVDDAHRSVVFSKKDFIHPDQRNNESFLSILEDSLTPLGIRPRASLFICAVGNDRYSDKTEGYFGNYIPLAEILDKVASMPDVEFCYHTFAHNSMKNFDAQNTKAIIQRQIDNFKKLGVYKRIIKILAYPYGLQPEQSGIEMLRKMGFKGALLAFPGTNEAHYHNIPACEYNKTLLTDPFLIPRICIGATIYTPKELKKTSPPYLPINIIEHFHKDVLDVMPNIYVSQG